METLSQEEWIVFRKKIYRFEDFLLLWQNKLKDQKEHNDLEMKILQEIHKYEVFFIITIYKEFNQLTKSNLVDISSSQICSRRRFHRQTLDGCVQFARNTTKTH